MLKKIIPLLLVLFTFSSAYAQVQRSNVYLFDLLLLDTTFSLTKPRYLTQFNANGYNNQPAFFSNEELFITVQFPHDNQTDIYSLDLLNKTRTRITATVEGEYSPMLTPGYYSFSGYHNFSAIRQEINGRDTVLRLWQFSGDVVNEKRGKPVFKYLTGIGYYLWLNSSEVVVFMAENPNYLGIASTYTDKVTQIARNVGRCFKRLTDGSLVYVQKDNYGRGYLMRKNIYSLNSEPLKVINTLGNGEDFEVMGSYTFLMGQGSKLYKYDSRFDEDWVEFADLRFYGISNITRLALSRDYKLAVVAD